MTGPAVDPSDSWGRDVLRLPALDRAVEAAIAREVDNDLADLFADPA